MVGSAVLEVDALAATAVDVLEIVVGGAITGEVPLDKVVSTSCSSAAPVGCVAFRLGALIKELGCTARLDVCSDATEELVARSGPAIAEVADGPEPVRGRRSLWVMTIKLDLLVVAGGGLSAFVTVACVVAGRAGGTLSAAVVSTLTPQNLNDVS